MIAALAGLIIADGWLDGSLFASDSAPLMGVKATILVVLVILLVILANLELAHLISATGVHIFKPTTTVAAVLLASSWYWPQFFAESANFQLFYLLFICSWALLSLMLHQAVAFGADDAIKNCSANFFIIFYLGLLSSFFLGIRIDFGLGALVVFVATIKSSDIGAYTIGKLFGRHKCTPKISPGKTWEGLAGAIIFAIITAYFFSRLCGIMSPLAAVIFGAVFAVIGQMGDLAESLIKRDAGQKDASKAVPGFGGLLDIVDSPLAAGPLAYLFFMLAIK
jgi:phosphatidate cytidylyltransferase